VLEQKNSDVASVSQGADQTTREEVPIITEIAYGRGEGHNGRGWLLGVSVILILASIAAVVGALQLYPPPNAARRLGRLSGYTSFQAVGAYLIWRFFLRKRRGALLLLCSLLLLEGSIEFLVGARVERSREYALIDSLLKSLLKGEEIRTNPEQYGSMAPLAILLTDYTMEARDIFVGMENEIAAQHLETMLTRRTYQDPNEIISAQKRLLAITQILDRCEARFRTCFERMSSSVVGLDLPDRTKDEFLAGYYETKDQGIADVYEYLSINRSLASAYSRVLDFVKSQTGEIGFQGEDIIFPTDEDADEYNSRLQEIDRIIEHLDGWLARNEDRTEVEIQRLER
jgi:hypothetical protein